MSTRHTAAFRLKRKHSSSVVPGVQSAAAIEGQQGLLAVAVVAAVAAAAVVSVVVVSVVVVAAAVVVAAVECPLSHVW